MPRSNENLRLNTFLRNGNTSLRRRIITVVATSFLLLTGFFLANDYYTTIDHAEQLTLQRLQGIVNNLALQINGDQHQELTGRFNARDDVMNNQQDQEYASLHKVLQSSYQAHDLNSPIYTFVKTEKGKGYLEFIVSSSEKPYFRHSYTSFPEEAFKNLDQGGTLNLYEDEFGHWLSAYAPIYNAENNIVAYVQADEKFDHFMATVRSTIWRNAGISVLGFGLIMFIVLRYLRVTLLEEEKVKKELKVALGERSTLAEMLEVKEQKLLEKAEELEQSNQDLTDFAHIASHDLKSPIRNMQSFAQLIQRRNIGKLDSATEEQLGFIIADADRAQKLIVGLLSYSTADKHLGDPEAFCMEHAAKEAKRNLSSVIAESGAKIIVEPMPSIEANLTLVSQVLQNLINNGIKYNQSTNPQIRIGAVEDSTNGFNFFVRDNGIGIPDKFQADIFKMFKRLHTRGEYEGSGIGLAFCDRVVNTYGGKMWLESQEGEGSTFFFTLPMARVICQEEKMIAGLN